MTDPIYKDANIPETRNVLFSYYYRKELAIPKKFLYNTEIIPVIFDASDDEIVINQEVQDTSTWRDCWSLYGDGILLYNTYKPRLTFPYYLFSGQSDRVLYTMQYFYGGVYRTLALWQPEGADIYQIYWDNGVLQLPHHLPVSSPPSPPFSQINVKLNNPDAEFIESSSIGFSQISNKPHFFEKAIDKDKNGIKYEVITEGQFCKKTKSLKYTETEFNVYDDIYTIDYIYDGGNTGWQYTLASQNHSTMKKKYYQASDSSEVQNIDIKYIITSKTNIDFKQTDKYENK